MPDIMDPENKVIYTVINSPRHTIKELCNLLDSAMNEHPGIENAVILEANVTTDPESIYEGAVNLTLYRPDIHETGDLTIPVLKANCVS